MAFFKTFRRLSTSAALRATPNILTTIESNGIATITFNNPSKLNALTEDLGLQFQSSVQELATNSKVRVVILTGAGTAFSAGGDLQFLEDRTKSSKADNIEKMKKFYSLYLSIRTLPVPTIAAINGYAVVAPSMLLHRTLCHE